MQLQVETQIYKKDAIKDDVDDARTKATSFITTITEESGIRVHDKSHLTDYVQVNSNDISMWIDSKERMALDEDSLTFYGYSEDINDNEIQHTNATYGNNGIVLYKPGTTTDGNGNTIAHDTPVVTINSRGANIAGTVTIGDKYQSEYLNENVQVGGRNLICETGTARTFITRANQSWFVSGPNEPVNSYMFSTYSNKVIADTSNLQYTLSFNYAITQVDTAFNLTYALRFTNLTSTPGITYSDSKVVKNIPIGQSGSFVKETFDINSDIRSFVHPDTEIEIVFGGTDYVDNENITLTISNLKLEIGNKATDWSPAPEDVQAEIDTKKSTHTIDSTYSISYTNALTWANASHSYTGHDIDLTNVKIEDTVRLGVFISDMGDPNDPPKAYIVGTVTEVNASSFTMDGKWLDTTVIDGGHILTGTIDAQKVNISNLTVGGGWGDLLNSNLQIGSRNYAITNWTVTSPYTNSQTNVTSTLVGPSNFTLNGTAAATNWTFNKADTFGGQVLTTGTYLIWVDQPNVGVRIGYGSSNEWLAQANNCIKDNPYKLVVTTEQPYSFVPTVVSGVTYSNLDVHLMIEKGDNVTDWSPAPEDVDVHQYVTQINSDGIWVTPSGKKPTNTSTGAGATGTKIDGKGVGIYVGGTRLAQYGTTTYFYKPDGTTVAATLNSDGLNIKTGTIKLGSKTSLTDANSGVYIGSDGIALGASSAFKVTSSGVLTATGATISGAITATSLTIDGNNYASDIKTISSKATPQNVKDAKEAAEKTATNYIGISGSGIKVAASSPTSATNYVEINSGAVNIVADSTHKTIINSSGMNVYAGDANNSVAQFGTSTRIGAISANTYRTEISSSGFKILQRNSGNTADTEISSFNSSGISFNENIPLTVGTTNSYIKWIKENNVWKIKIQADEITMGGHSVDTGGTWYTGIKITGTSTADTTFSSSGITYASVGDMYLNTSTNNTYRCTVAGNAATAKWVYVSNLKGNAGSNGQDGQDGHDGQSYYVHIRYSANSDGTSFTTSPQSNTQYIGIYSGTSSTAPTAKTSYTWSKYKGDKGDDTSSQYMTFTETNGLRVYSGDKNNNTYNTVYTQIKTDGITIRKDDTHKTVIDGSGMSVYAGKSDPIASFGNVATIGLNTTNNYRIVISSSGMDIFYKNSSGDMSLAHIGCEHLELQDIPCYTFGTRKANTTKGTYSFAEGISVTSSSIASHAEGRYTVASGYDAHAEGNSTTAEGYASHAGGFGTYARGSSQTVIGEYNIIQGTKNFREDTDKAFIIGNGEDANSRSNAFSVNWNGDVFIGNHSSAIGSIVSAYNTTAKSLRAYGSSDTPNTLNLCSIPLTAGTWVITGLISFPKVSSSGTNDFRRASIATSATDSGGTYIQSKALASYATCIEVTKIVSLTSSQTYYLNCISNQALTIAVGSVGGVNYIQAVRIA